MTGKFLDSSSCSSLSPASSEDNLCYPCREGSPLIPPACRTANTFEELAKRNGIKVGKVVTTAASVDALRPPRSSETCSSDKSLKREPTAGSKYSRLLRSDLRKRPWSFQTYHRGTSRCCQGSI